MDPIADMFSKIRNAYAVKKDTVAVPYSKLKMEIVKLLQKKEYIKDIVRRGRKIKKTIEVTLLYRNNKPAIEGMNRVSKPSRRVYAHFKDMELIRKGQGMLIVSTPKGILCEKTSRKEKVGGEVIGKVW
ncbi:MAG: 30S ribosomal protein S8 [bacterium]|nr:30S ribosomal protein S8 [bacterium]